MNLIAFKPYSLNRKPLLVLVLGPELGIILISIVRRQLDNVARTQSQTPKTVFLKLINKTINLQRMTVAAVRHLTALLSC